MRIYTLGHSTRELSEVILLLKGVEIGILVDIRRFPASRKFPHFNREVLERELEREGIRYRWMEELGGFRRGGYEKHMETHEFRSGIDRLLELAGEARTCILCAEIVWFRCHRRYVSNELVERDHEVYHIVDGKRLYKHETKGGAEARRAKERSKFYPPRL
jgi:uncharacterized protein (DUF488 family)